ncbi:M23 family metallopeptidase [Aurantiacibacter spongiae]|uniref:M23 family metallopeptidase n=1 Tax=Aurantiacibacter spongiae TaxID=2488860 RepID=A0A3N5CQU0_9SPHN|nr:M23 family metallopeptidase [Aurantiacibacter spongiae]RPF71453.1 M23 family metallopeptidase [Aurantiacibacter spongiae]
MHVKITTLAAVAAIAAISAPATAKENAPTGVIDTGSVTANPADDSAEFTELFASWEDLEEGGRVTNTGEIIAAPRASLAIPSRMPVDGVQLTSGYGMRDHPILRRRARHNGVDLAAASGTPVFATADGMVGKAQYFGSYGNYVQIEHGGDMETRYAHLSGYTVSAGQHVNKGDLIGYIGSTGRSTGPHLHYEVRVDGEPVNPIPYMTAHLDTTDDASAGRGGPE